VRRVGAAAVALLMATALLTSCSGDDTPAGTPSSGAGASASPSSSGPSAAEKLTQQLLGDTTEAPAVASASGTVEILGKRYQLVADVIAVRASASTTLLQWRLKSASADSTSSLGFWLSRPPLFDSRRVTILDHAGNHALNPFTYDENEHDCVCSTLPGSVDAQGEPLYGLYPPLAGSTTTVDITLPGFPAMKDVPVTRS